MTQLVQRRTFPEIIRDHHTRIRRLEAAPGGGGGSEAAGSECDRCYYVNPGDIYVEPEYRDCTDAAASSFSWSSPICGFNNVAIGSMPFGKCGMDLLGYGIAVRIVIVMQAPGDMENVTVNGVGPTFGIPSQSPLIFDSGWYMIGDQCGGNCDTDVTISASFYAANSGFGNCTLSGTCYAKWVPLNEDGDWEGSLEDIPAGESYGDVVYFLPGDDASSPRWRTGARSIPSRAISFFNSVLTSIFNL